MTQKHKLNNQAHALIAQKHQLDGGQSQAAKLNAALDSILTSQSEHQDFLEALLFQAESSTSQASIILEIEDDEEFLIEKHLYVEANEISVGIQKIKPLDYIDIASEADWDAYFEQVKTYSKHHNLELGTDPFKNLMSMSQKIALEKRIKEEFSLKSAKCDKYDYMIAGTCGLIGGLIDVFFVGLPGQSGLTQLTDNLTDKAVQKFASINGWQGARDDNDPTASAIGFLERNFKVNYDHRHGGDVGGAFKMSTKNHHIKSLAHSPDLVGLFFSILDQFTSTAHFVDNGKILSVDTEHFELQGSNVVSKIFSGFVNWLGHLFSDVAGSSGAQGRGSGIPIPFYPLLQFLNIGEFGQHRQTFAKIAVQVFEQGYDFRHGMAMSIPVLVTELLTRITWVIKRHFYHEHPWSECIPSANNPELRRMLLISHGSLCLVDTADAALRSGGNIIPFLLRSNLIAWARFGTLALKELTVWYREGSLDIDSVDNYLDTEYRRILGRTSF